MRRQECKCRPAMYSPARSEHLRLPGGAAGAMRAARKPVGLSRAVPVPRTAFARCMRVRPQPPPRPLGILSTR